MPGKDRHWGCPLSCGWRREGTAVRAATEAGRMGGHNSADPGAYWAEALRCSQPLLPNSQGHLSPSPTRADPRLHKWKDPSLGWWGPLRARGQFQGRGWGSRPQSPCWVECDPPALLSPVPQLPDYTVETHPPGSVHIDPGGAGGAGVSGTAQSEEVPRLEQQVNGTELHTPCGL